MMNPASMAKIINAKNTFEKNHPKFFQFIKAVFSRPIEEGTIVEVKVTRPGEEPITTNIKVMQSDLDLIDSLKDLQM